MTMKPPCGSDLIELGIQIKLSEGLNISAFLDHLELCEKSAQSNKQH